MEFKVKTLLLVRKITTSSHTILPPPVQERPTTLSILPTRQIIRWRHINTEIVCSKRCGQSQITPPHEVPIWLVRSGVESCWIWSRREVPFHWLAYESHTATPSTPPSSRLSLPRPGLLRHPRRVYPVPPRHRPSPRPQPTAFSAGHNYEAAHGRRRLLRRSRPAAPSPGLVQLPVPVR